MATGQRTTPSGLGRAVAQLGVPLALLVVVLVVAGCGRASQGGADPSSEASASFARVPVAEVADDVAAGRSLLVDVREDGEWDQGHAPQAIHIPLATVQDELDRIEREAAGRPVVFVCRSGRRSAEAAQVAVDAGMGNVSSIDGGMQAWGDAGRSIVPAGGSIA